MSSGPHTAARPSFRARMLLGVVLFALPLSALELGCATERTVTPPDRSRVTTRSGRGQGRGLVVVIPFLDRRPDQTRCGMQKNGYNMELARINCSVPPQIFLSRLFTDALFAAGFQVLSAPPRGGVQVAVVTGALEQYFIEPKTNFFGGSFEADIGLGLTVRTSDGRVAQRRFYVKGEQPTLWGSEADTQAASDIAIHALLLATVAGVANLLDDLAGATPMPAPGGP